MAQAIADPEELDRFASELASYCETLCSETGRIQGCFSSLGDTWQDEKRAAFEEQFNELVGQISRFEESCDDYVPFLHSLAERLRDYLQC
jgi:uncharacterized protein YukE